MFKALLSLVTALIISVNAFAQKDVTKFLGIPVDGTKEEMIRQLKEKGFRTSSISEECLEGEFNGIKNAQISFITYKDKVWRVGVGDPNCVDEYTIIRQFNRLCEQFENNSNYITTHDYRIPENEDISYGINVKSKHYEVFYFQKPVELYDTTAIKKQIYELALTKFTPDELKNPTPEITTEIGNLCVETYAPALQEAALNKSVGVSIAPFLDKFYIILFYDNNYNRPNGEDL